MVLTTQRPTLQRGVGGFLLLCTSSSIATVVVLAMMTVISFSTASSTPPPLQKQQEQEFKIGSMYSHRRYNYKRKMELRDEVQKAFYHGFDSYMTYAFPADEVKPISCGKHDNFAGYAVTAVDSLDTLALMGDYSTFMTIIKKLDDHLQFNANRKISVFETTIRILGGLISAHHLALKITAEVRFGPKRDTYIKTEADEELFTYKGEMLRKAVILADKLMPVFDTPTGIPFSETNLAHPLSGRGGGNQNCPAGAGTLLLEFGALGALTGNCSYLLAAERALESVWKHRGSQGLVGSELNIMSGAWVFPEATIGASVDSFYEYIHKAYVMFGDEKYLTMWHEAYKAIQKYTYFGGWYIMSSVHQKGPLDTLDHKFNSLTTFWPGLQTLAGDVHNALDSYSKMHCVLKKVGYFPEYLDLASFFAGNPSYKKTHGFHYPLRPEFIESTLFLYKATGEEKLLEIAETFFVNFMKTKHRCGFAALKNVFDKTYEDSMESFVLAETLKYLYIIFTPSKAEIAAENSMRRERRQERLRQVALNSKAYQRRRAHHSPAVNRIVDSELITALIAGAEAEELQAAHVEYKKLQAASPAGSAALTSLKSIEEYKVLGYPSDERPVVYEAPLYDLENGYIVNTEAHPIPLDINLHDFSKTCEWNRKNEKMDANTWSRISDSFRFFINEDKSIISLSEWEKAHMCPKVDYMRDVAPFIQRQFYSSGVADPCIELPDTQVLGDKSTTHFTTKNYATSLSSNKNARMKQIKADLDTREVVIRIAIELAPDPLAGSLVSGGALHAGSVTRNIATELSTRVSGPGASAINPKVIDYMGILGIPLVNEVENLYQLERNIMIRRVGPAPITQVDPIDHTYVQPFDRVRSDGTPWFDKDIHSRTAYSPSDAFFETSNANFGPKICARDMTPRSSLNVWASAPVFRAEVDPTGCLPSHIGETAMYPKPFGIASLRGGCTFREKALSAQLRGASFVIIVNTNDDYILMGDGVTDVPELMGLEVTIPLMAISKSLAESILPPVNVKLITRYGDGPGGQPPLPIPPSTILSVVCARNAPEQYKLLGAELAKIGDLAVIYRKRSRPLLEAFRSLMNDPVLRKDYAGHQRIQCPNCYLNVNYFSGDAFSKSADKLSELDVGFRVGFDLPIDVLGSEAAALEKHYSKLLMGAFRGADGSRLQFSLAPRPFNPSSRGVGLPSSSMLAYENAGGNMAQYMSAVGVVYFFTKGSKMGVAQILTYTINDGEAYAYYSNQLGAWLEENGSDEVGLNAHFSAIHEVNNHQVQLSEVIPSSLQSQQQRRTLVGSKVVEINIFEDVESCKAFNNPNFHKKEFTRGHVLRAMRNQFITDIRTPVDILDLNEAFRFPSPGPRTRKGYPKTGEGRV